AGRERETPQDDHRIERIETEEAEPEQPPKVLKRDRSADLSIRSAGQECNRRDSQERREKEDTNPEDSGTARHRGAPELSPPCETFAESNFGGHQSSRRTRAGGGSQAVAS